MLRSVTFVIALSIVPVAEAALVADYRFQNNFDSAVFGAPALTPVGPGAFAGETVDGTLRTIYDFEQGSGLSLSPTAGLIGNDEYSIVMLLRLDGVSSYARLTDATNATSENGLYVQGGDLNFYPWDSGTTDAISAGEWVQVVLTREAATDEVVGYVDGIEQIRFTDSANDGVIIANVLRFFLDDQGEESAGAVARIRIYDNVLSPAEVAALDQFAAAASDIPTASQYGLLAMLLTLGVVGALCVRRAV